MGQFRLIAVILQKNELHVGFNIEISTITVGLYVVLTEHFFLQYFFKCFEHVECLVIGIF